ncbi:MAG: Hint domain-containing protein [Rhodobacteraceae bacterium]|nr:Hint domain-containing protein [Paracoccaceae bacterium]MBR9821825.1 Hint domain-containing protein [Paracoccaceae bacterium]
MTLYNLEFFWIDEISTSNPSGFDNNGGYQFNLGSDTVTIDNAAATSTLVVDDNDAYFDDDDGAQLVAYDQWIDGVFVPGGTLYEAEYEIFVRAPDGQFYTLQFISANGDAFTIHGFAVHGPMPPFGVPLTVVGTSDGVSGVHPYAGSTAACFAAGTGIATDQGQVAAEFLRPGDRLALATGGFAELRLVLSRQLDPGPEAPPVRLQRDALGPGQPARRLVLSPQHRVFVGELGGLVPAKALTALPRVGALRDHGPIRYIHLVLDRHALILAEGLACESFWPGDQALDTLPVQERRRIRAIMGADPAPAAPFLRVRSARAALAGMAPTRIA